VTARQGGQTLLVFGRNFFSPRETTIRRMQVADTVTLVRGAHSWKAGFDVNRDEIKNFFPGNFGGRYTFNSLASLARRRAQRLGRELCAGFAGVGTTGPETHPDMTEYAVFAQDEWKVNKRLTLTFGLRYDRQDVAQPETRTRTRSSRPRASTRASSPWTATTWARAGRLLYTRREDGGARGYGSSTDARLRS
jgi:outer membrane receptor protein involved in Fe transport